MRRLALFIAVLTAFSTQAQEAEDTLRFYHNTVTVSAFETHDTISNVAGPIAVIKDRQLKFGNQGSASSTLNLVPGVKMEERGIGGSRRLNIRGSALRAPFGVRNIRAYIGDFAITSPDGSTPLEVVDLSSLESIEVIKGPSSSIYGAGTGGAIIFNPAKPEPGLGKLELGQTLGSYGFDRTVAKAEFGFKNGYLMLGYINQVYAGYRQQESINKDQVNVLAGWKTSETGTIELMAYHFNGSWGLAGAIDSAAVADDPTQAAQYSQDHDAHVQRVRTRVGIGVQQRFGKVVNLKVNGYGNFTSKENPYGTSPFFQGWKRENGQGFGVRAVTDWNILTREKTRISALIGAEYQTEDNLLREYVNDLGKPGSLKFDNETTSEQTFAYADLRLKTHGWVITAGLSFNRLNYFNLNLYNRDSVDLSKNVKFNPAFSPRFSVLKSINRKLSIHGSASWGFSPPTLWEVVSEAGGVNTDLKPETGLNLELGLRGKIKEFLFYDVSGYVMQLSNTIVPREDTNGVEIFTNSGRTDQYGAEFQLVYSAFKPNSRKQWSELTLTAAYAYQNYRFQNYIVGGDTLIGKKLPGVAPHSFNLTARLAWKFGLYSELRYRFVDQVPLNNLNTDLADSYSLLDVEVGYERTLLKRLKVKAYGGVNNLLNESYSSYFRLNGFGGKYYNPSAPLNWYAGVRLSYAFNLTKKPSTNN